MPAGIGASGVIGVAFEPTLGTYTAPTKFFPIKSETLMFNQGVTPRRVIRGVAGPLGFVKGNGIVEGEISMEVLPDVLPWFLFASRCTVVQTGVGPWVYTAKGNNSGSPTAARSLSITIVRNGIVFGYTGCIIGASTYSIEDGILSVVHKVLGMEEAVQTAPTATYNAASVPFGMGTYSLEIDDVVVADIGNVSISIEDNATPEYRLAGGTGADVVHFGENTTKITMDRDFITRAQYDKYRALTAEKFELTNTLGGEIVKFTIPVGVMTTYAISLSSVGDLVLAKTEFEGGYHAATGSNWEIAVTSTTENIT